MRRRASSSRATSSTGGTRRAGAGCGPGSPTTWPGCRTWSTTTSAPPATRRCSTSTCRSSPCARSEPEEHEVYDLPEVADEHASVYEHCLRALRRACTAGAHGLPLIGIGDWNDGMNRVGMRGPGRERLAGVVPDHDAAGLRRARRGARRRGVADELRRRADDYVAAVEAHGWDGEWYRRAYFDDGTPLGSARTTSAGSTPSPRAGASSPAPATRAGRSRRCARWSSCWCGRTRAC